MAVIYKNITPQVSEYYNVDVESLVNQERLNSFTINNDFMYRFIINVRDDGKFDLIFSFHHAIVDGWSVATLINQLLQIYLNLSEVAVCPLSYGEFVQNELAIIQDHSVIDYWQQNQQDLELSIPNFKFSNQASTSGINTNEIMISHEYTKKIEKLCSELGITRDIVFLAVYHEVLQAILSTKDFNVGLVVNNRLEKDGGDKLVGLFLNTIPYRYNKSDTNNAHEKLRLINKDKINLMQYKAMPYVEIKSKIDAGDLFKFTFNYVHFHVLNESKNHITDEFCFERTNIPFILNVSQNGNIDFLLSLSCHDDFMDANYLNYFSNIYTTSLYKLLDDEKLVCELPTLYYSQIVNDWNETSLDYQRDKLIHELFEEQVDRSPDNIALVYQDTRLTYRELNEYANIIAHYLRSNYVLKPDDLVALCVERNEYMIIAILATLKAGCGYVPLDISYPDDRIEYILSTTQASVLLINKTHKPRLEQLVAKIVANSTNDVSNVNVLAIDSQESTERMPKVISNISREETKQLAENLAYVIFTSGTTGNPKGVMIEHNQVVNTLNAINHVYNLNGTTLNKPLRVTQFTAYVFDVSVSEIFNTLLIGNELHIFSEDMKKSANELSWYLVNNQINITYLPPVILSLLNRDLEYKLLSTIIYAGEPCDVATATYWSNQKILYNYYGPTEATIYCLGKQVINGDANLIGRPIANTSAYILDNQMNLLPVGAIGELYIGGEGVARGYFNNPELTAERFIYNPFQSEFEKAQRKNSRLYKTGDLVRYLPDGNIEYIGRNDFQVKIRGYRIELGEIENILTAYSGIKQSVVIALEDSTFSNKYLVGYFVADNKLNEENILDYLGEYLPEYMIPSIVVQLDNLPLTINGKLDSKALPKPVFSNRSNYVAPNNELEEKICNIYAEVLGLSNEHVGVKDDFFRLGGNSILAIKLVNKLNNDFNINIKVADVFIHKTVRNISESMSYLNIANNHINLIQQLNKTNASDLMFMIHPGMAGCEVYVNLADKLIDKYQCYGVDNYNINNNDAMINDFEKLAILYLTLIDSQLEKLNINPANHQYNLLGWSFGGQISLKIASILEQRGVTNIRVYCLDTILSDNDAELTKLRSQVGINIKEFVQDLSDKNYEQWYIDKVILAATAETKLVNQYIDYKLCHTKVVLFKATQKDARFIDISKDLQDYVINLVDNNIGNIMINNSLTIYNVEDTHSNIVNSITRNDFI